MPNFSHQTMTYNANRMEYYNLVDREILQNNSFKTSYDAFIRQKTELNYVILVSFVNYKLQIIKNVLKNDIHKIYALIIYDNNFDVLYYSFLNSLDSNTFKKYTDKNILQDNNFSSFKPFYSNNRLTAVVLSKDNGLVSNANHLLTSSTQFKKVMYLGHSINYDSFNQIIDKCIDNHVTHILLEFIGLNADLTQFTYSDTILNWIEFSYDQRNTLLNKMRNNGMQLIATFGGSTSFQNGFQLILTSTKYSNPSVLADDLINFCYEYNIHAIDLNIEHYPMTNVYSDTIHLVNYAGELSQYIKQKSFEKFGYYILLSHSPQTLYFNNDQWGYVYNQIEHLYGHSIDFYNIRYYNQGNLYLNYDEIFLNDTQYFSSVNQLINASDIDLKYADIPISKIVVGKATQEETNSGGYIPLHNEDDMSNTMAEYVERTKYDGNSQIVQWSSQGGIMVWLYKAEQGNNYSHNNEIMNYFTYVDEHNKK